MFINADERRFLRLFTTPLRRAPICSIVFLRLGHHSRKMLGFQSVIRATCLLKLRHKIVSSKIEQGARTKYGSV